MELIYNNQIVVETKLLIDKKWQVTFGFIKGAKRNGVVYIPQLS